MMSTAIRIMLVGLACAILVGSTLAQTPKPLKPKPHCNKVCKVIRYPLFAILGGLGRLFVTSEGEDYGSIQKGEKKK